MATLNHANLSERTIRMKQQFMELHNQGFSIPEIAKKFSITPCTIYYHLETIAKENGRSRESLLQIVRTSSNSGFARQAAHIKTMDVNPEELLASLKEAEISVSNAIKEISEIICDIEAQEEEYE